MKKIIFGSAIFIAVAVSFIINPTISNKSECPKISLLTTNAELIAAAVVLPDQDCCEGCRNGFEDESCRWCVTCTSFPGKRNSGDMWTCN